jgi:hypothetical protein
VSRSDAARGFAATDKRGRNAAQLRFSSEAHRHVPAGRRVHQTIEHIAAARASSQDEPTTELPSILGKLAELMAELQLRVNSAGQLGTAPIEGLAAGDDEVDVREAARILGMSVSFMHKHAKEYGGAKHGSALRFSRRQLESKRKRRHYN